ncbi:hypothetical protein MPH_03004 [Macrophomina phaseolina MS6]|uniref:Uncharacterized protein n=1 Tax=Macrophomina phaseolina (strain MS6) TaxID=1126212 RepID=K2RY60_MACPH|nr:hypothetical protein MPH_03004 [Macrophomina phaseolina MS6]
MERQRPRFLLLDFDFGFNRLQVRSNANTHQRLASTLESVLGNCIRVARQPIRPPDSISGLHGGDTVGVHWMGAVTSHLCGRDSAVQPPSKSEYMESVGVGWMFMISQGLVLYNLSVALALIFNQYVNPVGVTNSKWMCK